MRAHPPATRLTLLAALCCVVKPRSPTASRSCFSARCIASTCVRRIAKSELIADLKRVRGKQGIPFALARAAVEHPDETVRRSRYSTDTSPGRQQELAAASPTAYQEVVARSRDHVLRSARLTSRALGDLASDEE